MILHSFFILFIIIFSSIGIVYATENNPPTHFVVSTTATVFLNPPVCEKGEKLTDNEYECIPKPTQSSKSSSSGSNGGGCGITGVGPGGPHGPHGYGGASGAIGRDCGLIGVGPGDLHHRTPSHQSSISSDTIPLWVSTVILWWIDDKLTQEEFQNSITYMLDQNIIPNNIPKPDTALVKFDPTTKRIFELWVNGNLQDNYILKIIQDYRQLGYW